MDKIAHWFYFHSLDPFIIQFTQNFGIRWYSMSYIAGFFTTFLCIRWLVKKNISPLSKKDAGDIIVWLATGAVLGGRLGYAIFYAPHILISFDSSFPYWQFLKVHEGGMASHGGLIGVFISALLFAKKRKLSTYHCLDLTAFGFLGVFFGRIANFINGELYGRIIQNKALIAVQFPQEMYAWIHDKKTELLDELSSAVSQLSSALPHLPQHLSKQITADPYIWNSWIEQLKTTGQYISGHNIYATIHALILACEQNNLAVINALEKLIPYRHPSQIYQAFLEGLLPFLLVCFLWTRKKALKPGMISCIGMLSYGVMRIIGEQFRMPDIELGFRALGLTRGQWLSVGILIFIAFYFIVIFKRSKPLDIKK